MTQPKNEKSLPELFHVLTAASIDAKGVFPHHCLDMKEGKLTGSSLMLRTPHEVYTAIANVMASRQPDELIYGLDRFCKPGQGTTLKDCIAGAYWYGKGWYPFVIEYQHEPRIVKPIDWHNETWTRFITDELVRFRLAARLVAVGMKPS